MLKAYFGVVYAWFMRAHCVPITNQFENPGCWSTGIHRHKPFFLIAVIVHNKGMSKTLNSK